MKVSMRNVNPGLNKIQHGSTKVDQYLLKHSAMDFDSFAGFPISYISHISPTIGRYEPTAALIFHH